MKKKKSPSQLWRETRRRLERKDKKESESTAKVSDKDSEDPKLFACSKCDSKFKSQKGLNIHIGKAYKSEVTSTPEWWTLCNSCWSEYYETLNSERYLEEFPIS